MNELALLAPGSGTAQTTTYSDQLVFWLNGRKIVLPNPDPTVLLTDYLHSVGLTGTKVGCGQGGCGACTVMLSHRDPLTGAPVHRAVNSCLRPLCAVDGMVVTTTEGIAMCIRASIRSSTGLPLTTVASAVFARPAS
jgi:xanthine dehydrogenase iron-sulfur cluster and FAD-binding subunit A